MAGGQRPWTGVCECVRRCLCDEILVKGTRLFSNEVSCRAVSGFNYLYCYEIQLHMTGDRRLAYFSGQVNASERVREYVVVMLFSM